MFDCILLALLFARKLAAAVPNYAVWQGGSQQGGLAIAMACRGMPAAAQFCKDVLGGGQRE